MASYVFSKHVDAPPQRTFAVFTDFANVAEHVSGITDLEVLTAGPVGKGTRFKETRMMFNREVTEEMEITDFQAGRSFTLGCKSCGAVWSTRHDFHPHGDGTRIEMQMNCTPVSFMAKLMSPLSFIFAGSLKKCIEMDLEELTTLVESSSDQG